MKSNKTGNYYECRQNAVRGLKTYLDQLEHMCQTHIILCGPREHMMVLKIKIYAALYRKLWKCIPVTQVSDSIWHSIYNRNGLWCAYDMQWLGLGVWGFLVDDDCVVPVSQRNKADLIKCPTDGKTRYSRFSNKKIDCSLFEVVSMELL